MNRLQRIFDATFAIERVDSPELFGVCSRIRYEILCEEGRIPGFDPKHYPEGRERDRFDDHAQSFLLKHRQSGEYIGTIRMILSPGGDHRFAIEDCPDYAFYPGKRNVIDKHRPHMAEISRLMILPSYRRRLGDQQFQLTLPQALPSIRERRLLHPMIGLFKAIIMVTDRENLQCWCSIMEPSLYNTLTGLGIHMEPMGPDIVYHGTRRIYFCRVPDIVNQVYKTHKEVWTLLTDNGILLTGQLGKHQTL
ncbi:MAG: PEP-CTERM/exosortase system-associated acyltransferase [Gammaproteobacteria bacterium]|nr:PEP-CTERM/exosortase system-associated acyltransferase [Gammaproteobacteria bacterium]